MQPQFYQIGQAIREMLAYYDIGRIKSDMDYLAGTSRISSNPPIEESWYNLMFELHARMEAEINQVIHTCNQNTQVFLFETLKEWLNDYRIKEVNINAIYYEIDTYNERAYADFALSIEEKVKIFRSTLDFINRKHKEEYEVETTGGLIGLIKGYSRPFLTKRINYSYYCITENPDLIDESYLPQYVKRVSKLIDNFKSIVSKYVTFYDAAKIVPSTTIIIEQKNLSANNSDQLLPATDSQQRKLKINLTVKQLAYLFRLFKDVKPDIIETKTNAELFRWISENFTTKGKADTPISTNAINNHFSDPEKEIAKFWASILAEMLKRARKV